MSESPEAVLADSSAAWDLRPRSVFSILENHASRGTGAEAIVSGDRIVTYAELVERVGDCARMLVLQGLVPGLVTGLSVPDDIDHLTVALALICLGAPQLNLGSQEAAAVKEALLAKLGVTQIVAARPETWMEGATVCSPARTTPLTAVGALDLKELPLDAILLYCPTSGSTNVPKTFGLTFERLLLIARRHAESETERRVLRTSPIEFHSTRLHRLCALLAGNTCVLAREFDLKTIGDLCARAEVSEIHIGTYKLVSLLRGGTPGTKRLPSFTRVVAGGSRVPGSVRRATKERLTENLFISYASSEVGPISLGTPAEHEAFPEGVGLPLPGVIVRVVDEDGNEVAPGEVGQAKIRKAAMPRGYFEDVVASSAFRDGWFYPRDLLSRAEGGPLVFHGRVDDMMILNGINIFPSAIEDTLENHPDVSEAVAYAIPSRIHGEIPVAAVVLRDGTQRDASHLLGHCRQTLGIRAPRQVIVVDRIPRNAAGKPLRRELAKA